MNHQKNPKPNNQFIINTRTLSSASKGRWSRISSGSVSAAITMNSEIPLLRVLVAEIFKACINTTKQKKQIGIINIELLQTGTFISALFELLVVGSLLNEIQNGYGELRIRQGVCFWIHCFTRSCLKATKSQREWTRTQIIKFKRVEDDQREGTRESTISVFLRRKRVARVFPGTKFTQGVYEAPRDEFIILTQNGAGWSNPNPTQIDGRKGSNTRSFVSILNLI